MLSVIIPAYNEQENIRTAADTIRGILNERDIAYEMIFVDDGSRDGSWQIIDALTREDENIRGLRFSRNFGKEGAIFAGLRRCKGDCAVVIDCDLQHPPALIPKMYKLWEEGAEVVEAVKSSRGKEGLIYKLFAKSFYRIMKRSSDVDLDRASDFKLMDRRVIDALNEMPERLTFFRALSSWVGFKTEKVEFEVAPRNAGRTKWKTGKLIRFALNNITSFTTFPMQIITALGVIFFIFAAIMGVQTLVTYFSGNSQNGFTTVYMLILISASFIMIGLGIVGWYMSKIYEEIKFRPRYIISLDTDERKECEKDSGKSFGGRNGTDGGK